MTVSDVLLILGAIPTGLALLKGLGWAFARAVRSAMAPVVQKIFDRIDDHMVTEERSLMAALAHDEWQVGALQMLAGSLGVQIEPPPPLRTVDT